YLGVCCVEAGRLQEAETYFAKALTNDPNHAASSFELSNLLIRERRYEEAAKRLQKLLAVPEYQSRAHLGLGRCYLELGELDLASVHLDQALKLNPSSLETHYLLGMVQFQKRDK